MGWLYSAPNEYGTYSLWCQEWSVLYRNVFMCMARWRKYCQLSMKKLSGLLVRVVDNG